MKRLNHSPLLAALACVGVTSGSVVASTSADAASRSTSHPAPAAPPAEVAVEDPALYPLADVKRGLKGYGYTVFESASGPERFEFEVLGVMRSYLGPGEDLIIAELKGDKIERTGVISGMSGSPVYVDGKLVGAVGYRFGSFTDKPIAGITPIERMLTVGSTVQSSRPSPVSGPPRRGAMTAWGAAEPLAVPIMTTGLPTRVLEAFRPQLEARGYGPFVPGAAPSGGRSEAAKPQRFFAGGPIAGLLVDGDVQMAGIGTVTWVKGDRVLGFGHPFLGNGATSMPISNAWIVTTVASAAGSWKMGQATTPQGALTDDRLHAIAGDMSARPRTVPVRARVEWESPRAAQDADTDLSFSVLRHPTDTPLFTALALANGLSSRVGVELGGTVVVAGTVALSTGHTYSFERRAAGDGVPLDVNAAIAVLSELSALQQQSLADVEIERVDLRVTRREAVEQRRVLSVDVGSRLRAGGEATVRVRLQPFQGAVEERVLRVRVPRGVPAGKYALVAASRKEALEMEGEGGLLADPVDFDGLLRSRAARPPDGSLSLYLVADAAGLRVDGQGLPDLPASLVEVLAGGGGLSGRALEQRVVRLTREALPGVVDGVARARIQLEPPASNLTASPATEGR